MLMAVGFVALATARLDEALQELFCGLEESKYAAVTAGGQSTMWLLDACYASAEYRAALTNISNSIRDRIKERNSYVHSIWELPEPGEDTYFARSRHHSYSEDSHWATTDQVIKTGRALAQARKSIRAWMKMVGIKGEELEGALREAAFWNFPIEDGD